MPDLIAQGPDRLDRWRRRLSSTETSIHLGRESGVWSVLWDACISRDHAQLEWDGRRLDVCRLETATNLIYFRGEPESHFQMEVGDFFVIGDTRFSLVDDRAQVSLGAPLPVDQQTFSAAYLRGTRFHHARQQVQALTRLPEVIEGANTDAELSIRMINLILTGVLAAEAAAVICRTGNSRDESTLRVLHWDCVRADGRDFQPSGELIHEALNGEQSVIHYWDDSRPGGNGTDNLEFDWAFSTPMPGTAYRNQAIYVTGRFSQDAIRGEFHDALKFVELVSTTVAHVADLRRLQSRSAALSQFFSAPVRDVIATGDPEVVLAPRKTDVTVMFCDLRGFSRQSEQDADDLFGLLQRVSEAMGIMTRQILEFGGVVGDFHGDAAMGFWGWPLQDEHRVVHACRSALAIRAGFKDASHQHRHALSKFRVGVGLASGEAVAGKLGTIDQVKVTAFGPVVNLASRLEGLTRRLGVAILIDESTARIAEQELPTSTGRVRRVARLQPFGLTHIENIYELVPNRGLDSSQWKTDCRSLERAIEAFGRADWSGTLRSIEPLSPDDPIRHFYSELVPRYRASVAKDWDGVIRFGEKH